LAEANVETVTLVGGDPGIYPHAFDLVRYGHLKGLHFGVLSNTHAYPGSSVKEMSRYVSAFETTFHAPTAREHDAFCRKDGAYDSVIGKLHEAKHCGQAVGLTINIIRQTAHCVFDIADAVVNREGVSADYVVIQRIIPFGGAKNKAEFVLNRNQVLSAMEQVDQIHHELGLDVSVVDPFPMCVLPDHLKKYMHPCQWGLTEASVDDRGNLSRCGADPRGSLGNILERPLLDTWNHSPALIAFREQKHLLTTCKKCGEREDCGGGCPLSCDRGGECGGDYLIKEETGLKFH
jgi:radical SAM protein with 4Fe4S-binding SPASM domain